MQNKSLSKVREEGREGKQGREPYEVKTNLIICIKRYRSIYFGSACPRAQPSSPQPALGGKETENGNNHRKTK